MTRAALKQNQVIAVLKGTKADANKVITEVYHRLQKAALLEGIARSYTPKNEDGDQLPPESTRVQVRVSDALNEATAAFVRLFDTTATLEYGNTTARADVVVGGKVLFKDAPVPYLLFLEKQLVDIRTLALKLPVLDPSQEWNYDQNTDTFATPPVRTTRTKKVPRNHVKAPATDKHPAQVELYYEDEIVGTWTQIKYSGALPQKVVTQYLARIDELTQAVKMAREEANSTVVQDQHVGQAVFDYLFG